MKEMLTSISFPSFHPKFPLKPNSQHQYYRRDISITSPHPHPSFSHPQHPLPSRHSYFINISGLRTPISLALLGSPLCVACSHSAKWSKGALTPIIKELLKLALTGHLVAAECQQRFSLCFDCLSFLYILLNSALAIDSVTQINTHAHQASAVLTQCWRMLQNIQLRWLAKHFPEVNYLPRGSFTADVTNTWETLKSSWYHFIISRWKQLLSTKLFK